MRSSFIQTLAAIALLATQLSPVVASRHALFLRDGPPPSSQAESAAPSSTPTTDSSKGKAAAATAATDESSSSASAAASSGDPKSKSSTASAAASSGYPTSDGIVHGPTGTPIANSSLPGNITNIPQIEGLPVHPQVTPALAVAGAIMILTGALYTLIGIKTKWLHIFCSTAYLFSLCVVILIVYVMNPPIPNAIQGAYFVAAAATGIIFGAIAVIFADVTEGLGCFLGGFCLGMWFLVLKPGGIITSQAGKSIFLGCFTVAVFALYISHYTRPYGLIGSTSFAGATVVILGVDMFSRAGLKEFWLYIWDLNDGVFPLNYDGPYPITRGMRVEIACIVLLCLLGVMSQMKIWNVVKERRERKEAEERRRDELRDQAEEELGRRIEGDNDRDRAVWDAVYNNKGKGSQTETTQSSTRRGSASVVDLRETGGMEMQSLASASSSMRKGMVTVHVGQDDDTALPSPAETRSLHSKIATSREPSIHDSHPGVAKSVVSDVESIRATSRAETKKPFVDPKLSLKPKFVPLPFKVPDTNAKQTDDDDKSSVATFAASDNGQVRPPSRSKRISGSSLVRKLSGKSRRTSMIPTASEEALVVPHDDDQASSVAVTLDGISVHSLSRERLASRAESPVAPSTHSSSTGGYATPDDLPTPKQHEIGVATSDANVIPSVVDTRVPKQNTVDTAQSSIPVQELAPTNPYRGKPKSAVTASSEAEPRLVPTGLAGNLPSGASRVVTAYRTNEWAKHLDTAEAPVFEEVKPNKVVKAPVVENTAPVNVQELQQTALTAEPEPAKIDSITPEVLPSSPKQTSKPSSASQSPRISPSASQTNLAKTVSKSPSQVSLTGETSRPTLPRTRASSSSLGRGLRSSSTPMISSPLAGPIDEDAEASFPSTFTPSPMHLMSQRESTLQSRPGSTSLQSRNSGLQRSSSASSSLANIHENIAGTDDDLTLAQRKSMLQQSQSTNTLLPPQRSASSSSAHLPYGSHLNLSHNPSRLSLAHARPNQSATLLGQVASTDQRDSTISAWRSSLANDASYENARETKEIEMRRNELIQEKQAARNSKAVEKMQEQARRSIIDREMMRRGSGMMDAHREAMRRMQGSVNEKLKNGS